MFKKTALSMTMVSLMGTAAFAQAQIDATAATDLNLRAGPAPTAEIISVIPADGAVKVEGCLDTSSWCRVDFDGTQGWAYGDYLTAMVESKPVAVYPNRQQVNVTTVTYDDTTGESATGAGTIGAIIGGLTGGPIGAAAGAVIGAGAGAVANPGPDITAQTETYVTSNPVDPVYLDGEVVVGVGIPDTVTLNKIPDSTYSYQYINGVPVIVDPAERRVVRIVR